MSKWRSEQLRVLGKWVGVNAIFFILLDLVLPADFAAGIAMAIILLAFVHPANKQDRDALTVPIIELMSENANGR